MSQTLAAPANGFPAGTKLLPSGTFAGYTVEPLVDGVADRDALPWNRRAWASGEDGAAAWLEARLPAPRTGGTLEIDWNDEDGLTPSRAFTVEAADPSGAWSTVADVTGNDASTSSIALPATPYAAVRITQQPGGGSDSRPDLMWVAQLRLAD